jgi:hypothetical protein
MTSRGKTVFVLGAGFSKDAEIPLQGELLPKVLERTSEEGKIYKFIKDIYSLTFDQAKSLDLEDIYTPLHQSIVAEEYIKSYPPSGLQEIEKKLNLSIAEVIDESVGDDQYIKKFATYLIEDKKQAPSTDHFAVLSLNWDILLDKHLFASDNIVMNYGCHTTGLDIGNKMIPVLTAKERNRCIGKLNERGYDTEEEKFIIIKQFKMHGSLNWATCPKCRRVFVTKQYKSGIKALEGRMNCPLCEQVKLKATLLLPSFQKELQKYHFQQIWTQAAKEISESTKVVFIGYSFPLADFDFRSLLTKHLNDNVEVNVVSYSDDSKIDNTATTKRYRKFFGEKINQFYGGGAKKYISEHLK